MATSSPSVVPGDLSLLVVGIDVGGPTKGFHAVALEDGCYRDQLATGNVEEMVRWSVKEMGATVIAIDAPCGWSTDGRCRPAERTLMEQGIYCFATPQESAADTKPFYRWMLRGMELYHALAATHPVRDPRKPGRVQFCFETFPHAITWYLRGGSDTSARRKRSQRRELLDQLGIDRTALTNIDKVDAALCAYTAHLAAMGAGLHTYGEVATGLIVVPPRASEPAV